MDTTFGLIWQEFFAGKNGIDAAGCEQYNRALQQWRNNGRPNIYTFPVNWFKNND